MNVMLDLLNGWSSAMWRASWHAGIAAIVVWIVCRTVPTIPARFRAWMWRFVVVKFAVALLWTMPVDVPILPVTTLPAQLPVGTVTDVVPAGLADVAQVSARHEMLIFGLFFVVWCVVLAVSASRILAAWCEAQRLRNDCLRCVDERLLTHVTSYGNRLRLRRLPAVLMKEGEGSPLLIGVIRPAIIVPAALITRLDVSEQCLVVRHELAHLSRGDLAWGMLSSLVRAIFFFHPLAWLADWQLRLTQEIAADELAMSLEQQQPVQYATLLVSIVSKLSARPLIPAMSVGTAGPHQSLQARLSAMRFMQPMSTRKVVAYCVLLGSAALLGMVPWRLVAAEPSAVTQTPPEKSGSGRGKFVSYKDEVLTIQANDGSWIKNKIPTQATTLRWVDPEGFQSVDTSSVLSQLKPGTWVHVVISNSDATIRIGARKAKTVGTFVSFKENRLLILGKNLGESFTKKYGNNVHFNKFRDDVPAYESVDGGEYKLIGVANKVLGDVKEGTILTIHGEGDDNITLVQIGVPNKK